MTKFTDDRAEAARLVAAGEPVVLVGPDASELGRFVAAVVGALAGGRAKRQGACLLGVLVGELAEPTVASAAEEMAAELWPWAAGR